MPNRIIKESICSSDSIDQLSWFEEVLFYRLIVSCDDYGRYDGRAAIIKNRLFPLKENLTLKAVSEAIKKLASAELISLYEFEGRPYLYLPTWNEHQTIRAKRSKFPAPEDGVKTSEIICKHMQADEIICNQMQANAPVIQSNPIQSVSESKASIAHTRGEYGWVKLTDKQYEKLLKDLGQEELDRCIKYVDESAQSTGNKNEWKDWNLTIRRCSRDGWGKNQYQSKPKKYVTAAEYVPPVPKSTEDVWRVVDQI